MTALSFRPARPDDHGRITAVMDQWWGRPVHASLPRLFLDHFHQTSTVVEDGGELAGFLVAFLSPSEPDAAYIHFVGVHPDLRGAGLARTLYTRFFDTVRAAGRTKVSAVTAPVNQRSIAFHTAMGFTVASVPDYDGPGVDRVAFHLELAP